MIIERRSSLKAFRGPLKATRNFGTYVDSQDEHVKKPTTTLPSRFHCDDSQTPVQRATHRCSQVQPPDVMQNLLPMPLRTSSRRLSTDSGISDIRRHFPVRGLSVKMTSVDQNQKLTQTNEFTDSLFVANESPYSAEYSGITSPPRKRHSTASDIHYEVKQSRLDNLVVSPFQSLRTRPGSNCLTMGAEVKAHPRYHRRRSAASEALPGDEDQTTVLPTNRLAPICSVPMPLGFPSRLPPCASVSFPWDSTVTPVRTPLKTAETQTSPLDSQSRPEKPRGRRHTGFGRQSSGTMQIIHSIRKKFGHLRRAISADRLNRNSIGPGDLKSETRSQHSVDEDSNKNHEPSCFLPRTNDPVGSSNSTESKLTCQVKRQNGDGSVQIVLRRSSIAEQFGFFIARDSHGIYISRLGSVKCAAAVWNIFHVGDRILEVQGHKCTTLEVEDVQNLIRGCELVEFRVKSTRSDFCRAPFR